jgi:hypothetical protein
MKAFRMCANITAPINCTYLLMPNAIHVTVSGIIIWDAISLAEPEFTNINGKEFEMTHGYKDMDDNPNANQESIDDAREI